MALGSLQEVSRDLISLQLITIDQLDLALADLNRPTAAELLKFLEARGLLTSFQITKLENGEKTGYLLGRFKLQYRISAGTFARVFRGIDVVSGETVAIKVLRAKHATNPEFIRQFEREGRLTESFHHPNITRMLEVGTDRESNQHYIAMEFVEGGNFREFLKIRGKFNAEETIRLGREMVDGLRYALARGVTHRDIKPTNILLSAQGQVKWVDFGLGGGADDGGSGSAQRTVDYAGLEKATGAPKGDPRSDIFFLGAVLYQMLKGEPPMPETKDKNARMLRTRFDRIPTLADDPEIPSGLAAIVDRMLALNPAERYQTYDPILADLDALATGVTATAGKATAPAPADEPPRVLVIHRSPKIQDIIRQRLSKKGYQVVLTTDISRALNLMKFKPAHCLIIDLETTGHEAIDAYRNLQKKNAKSNDLCPAIFLAEANQMDWTKEFSKDHVTTLQKPLTLGPVYAAVKAFAPRPDAETDD
jgi:serine/threonine protein kinase